MTWNWLFEQVKTREDAERTIAVLMSKYSSSAAKETQRECATASKQSASEIRRRTASNLLRFFSVNK